MGHSAAGKVVCRGAFASVASDHAEAGRESSEFIVVGPAAGAKCRRSACYNGSNDLKVPSEMTLTIVNDLQVIDSHAAHVTPIVITNDWYTHEASVLSSEVEFRSPY